LGRRSEYFENARSRSIGVVASFYPAALGSFSQKHLRQGLGLVVKTVCENINWLAEAVYTSREISKCGGLADAKITSTEMLAHRKKLPVCHSITMSDADYHDHQMFAKIANLPSDELAHEICRIAQAILLDKLRRKFEVDVNKSTRSKFTKYKISWPDSKIELDG
jgi:hypothetical protein